MINEGYYPLGGLDGYLLKKLPQDIHSEVKSVVDTIQSDFSKAIPYNHNLAGQIDKEYYTQLPNKTTQYIKDNIGEHCNSNLDYYRSIKGMFGREPILVYEGGCWVNFQEKYEYNPMHSHDGVFSFVIWYQIPFYKEDEIKYGSGKGKKPQDNKNGNFEFISYNGRIVTSTPLGIDKSMEGYMAIFPSSLHHIVYPFYTSDDYRVTLSGNVFLSNGSNPTIY